MTDLGLSHFPIRQGSHASLAFEEAAEGGGLGEMEAVGYCVDHHRRVAQQYLGFDEGALVEPIEHGASALLAHDGAEVIGREQQLRGVKGDVAFAIAVLIVIIIVLVVFVFK